MTVSVEIAARRICEIGDWSVSNLALQKILYLAHMYHLGLEGEPLVDGCFEAWDYGPVHPELYRRVSMFGAKPIMDIFRVADNQRAEHSLRTINTVAPDLVKKPAAELVSITHWSEGAWAKNYRPGLRGIIIPDLDILNEFKTRAGRAKAA